MAITIHRAQPSDQTAVWQIIHSVIASGDTYVFDPRSSEAEMIDFWFGANKHTYVAKAEDQVVGTFIIKDNQPGLGSHVANASYMTSPEHFGKGIGTIMGKASLDIARELGYKAMQFNIVVSSNERAVRLWQRLGFKILGEIPEVFRHTKLGYVSAYVMWQKL